MRYKMILTALWLITCLALPAANLSDKVVKQNQQKIERFKANTGFTGEIQQVNDTRIFYKMQGTFPLPEPVDTVVFKSNCQKITKYVRSFYNARGDNLITGLPNRSRVEIANYTGNPDDINYKLTYLQYYNGFRLSYYNSTIAIVALQTGNTTEGVDCSLDIRYSLVKKQYIITNRLLPDKITLQKPRITQKQALELVRIENQKIIDKIAANYNGTYPKRNFTQRLSDYYISVLSTNGNKPYTYKYVYSISSKDVNESTQYLVDGITGEVSKPMIYD